MTSARRRIAVLVAPYLLLIAFAPRAEAQFPKSGMQGPQSPDAAKFLKEPTQSRVYQRDENDFGTIAFVPADDLKDAKIVSASLFGQNLQLGGMGANAVNSAYPGVAANVQLSSAMVGQGGIRQPMTIGLHPSRHIAGFSIRAADGSEIPMIFEALAGPSRDAVILKLSGKVPEGASLWYGWGFDPVCNLVDALDMAVPVFGPIALDPIK